MTKRRAHLLGIAFGLLLALGRPSARAEEGSTSFHFDIVLQGFDPATGALLFEGPISGDLTGVLRVAVSVTRITEDSLHCVDTWTAVTANGDTLTASMICVISFENLHLAEHGVVTGGSGALASLIGSHVSVSGSVSDLLLIPGVTTSSGIKRIGP